ncbi:cell division protein FtsQ/DivIB [Desulfonatronovibrio magnus]|uniref:cell division protein FtsQ/DivIB n=1 Tax=Desulfonatronovibrio magnus TaxID=698827 RepID=UPI0005EB435A|nr:FtsQ-type POTRA domain-containing protein [Desulfonatronovibrio magnus]
MAYSASVRTGHRSVRSNKYRKPRKKGLIKGLFMGLLRLMGASFLLALSIIFLITVSIGILYGYNLAMHSDFFALKHIEVNGNKQLTYAKLTELMEVNPGDNVLQLRMSELQSRLRVNPWVESVSLQRVFPDKLVINISERQAYFWIQDGEKMCYADARGRIITSLSPGRFVSLPVLYIERDKREEDLESLVMMLENRAFPFSLQDISWINIRNSGTVEMRVESQRMKIIMDRKNLRSGPVKLNRLWADLRTRGETDSVQRIIIAGSHAWVAYRD